MQRRTFLQDPLTASGLLGVNMLNLLPEHAHDKERCQGARRPGKQEYRIDAYCHFATMAILDYLEETGGMRPHIFRSLFAATPTLIDVDQRLALMDATGIDLSVLVPLPWIETAPPVHADPQQALGAARMLNDDLTEIVARHPDRFMAVALLPTTNPDVMLPEFERAVKELGMVGGCFVVGPTVKPPDHPDYELLYQKAVELDVPLWLHPSRPPTYPDYVGEQESQFQVWQALSWLLDSSTAMVRLVFSGVFARYPGLKMIIHHHGALVPLFAQRMQYGWDYFEQNTGRQQPKNISSPYIEHFKQFYCDTATQGYEPRLLEIAVNFFGPERVLFGSDAPMDATFGRAFTDDATNSLLDLDLKQSEREQIFAGNFLRLINRVLCNHP